MELGLTQTQLKVRDLARDFAQRELAPKASERDLAHTFPADELSALANQGMMGMNIRAEYGGSQWGVIAYSHAITELAREDASVGVIVSVNNMVGEVLQEFGSDAQRAAHIPKMTSGQYKAGSFCLSEPGSGSDAAGMLTRAVRTEEGWTLNGTKSWITSGTHAGVYLVWAKTEMDSGEDRISAFLVDPKAEGVSVGRPEEKMGQCGSDTVTLTFEDVKLPADAMLGLPGQGFKIAMMALDGGRIGVASLALGLAEAAAAQWRAHLEAGHRATPGLGQEALTEALAQIEEARALILRAAWLKDLKRGGFTREASQAKVFTTELATRVCEQAVNALGVAGSAPGSVCERLVRDARVTRIYEGTSEIQRVVIARELMRRA